MDQGHEDYADRDAPPPMNWMSEVVWPLLWPVLSLLGVIGVAVAGCVVLWLLLGPAD